MVIFFPPFISTFPYFYIWIITDRYLHLYLESFVAHPASHSASIFKFQQISAPCSQGLHRVSSHRGIFHGHCSPCRSGAVACFPPIVQSRFEHLWLWLSAVIVTVDCLFVAHFVLCVWLAAAQPDRRTDVLTVSLTFIPKVEHTSSIMDVSWLLWKYMATNKSISPKEAETPAALWTHTHHTHTHKRKTTTVNTQITVTRLEQQRGNCHRLDTAAEIQCFCSTSS